MSSPIGKLLTEFQITPVLVDVGASGAPPPIWRDIAAYSTYVGFDPDLREIHEDKVSQYRSSVIIPAAITERIDVSSIPFYLTKSPFCSTTLGPNPRATAHWLEGDSFVVESETTLQATTIDAVLKQRNLSTIDWIKLDTQGTDLRLLNSLSSDVQSRLMAIDTEPGLIEIYQKEDMFVDVHRDLTQRGFWLSDFHTGGFYRMRGTTLAAVRQERPSVDPDYVRNAVRTSPAYLEARYLRTLEWLADHNLSQREYTVLWIFALVDRQFGFALDLNQEYERRFGATAQSRTLKEATWQMIDGAHRHTMRKRAFAPYVERLTSVARRILGS